MLEGRVLSLQFIDGECLYIGVYVDPNTALQKHVCKLTYNSQKG